MEWVVANGNSLLKRDCTLVLDLLNEWSFISVFLSRMAGTCSTVLLRRDTSR